MRRLITALFCCAALVSPAQTNAEWRDSLKVLNKEIEANIDSVDLHLKKAAVNIQLEQWEYAKKEYDDILQGQPYNPAALFYRAFVYEKMRMYPMARVDYEKLLKMFPRHFEARLALVHVNQKDGRFTDAYDQANRLVEIFPDSALSYVVRAGVENERGYRDLAVEDMGEAISRVPDNPDFYVQRAQYLIGMKRRREARQDLERAVALGQPRTSLSDLFDKTK